MKKRSTPLRRNFLTEIKKDQVSKVCVNFDTLLTECCQEFQECDDPEKVEILKKVLLLLMNLVFDDKEVKIEMGQGYVTK